MVHSSSECIFSRYERDRNTAHTIARHTISLPTRFYIFVPHWLATLTNTVLVSSSFHTVSVEKRDNLYIAGVHNESDVAACVGKLENWRRCDCIVSDCVGSGLSYSSVWNDDGKNFWILLVKVGAELAKLSTKRLTTFHYAKNERSFIRFAGAITQIIASVVRDANLRRLRPMIYSRLSMVFVGKQNISRLDVPLAFLKSIKIVWT